MKFRLRRTIATTLVLLLVLTQGFIFTPTSYAADTPNLALGKTITASSHTQVYYATNANDGNINTYWEGAPGSYPNYLTVDLGSVQNVYKVVLKLNPSWETRNQTLSVLGSTNGSNYTTLKSSQTYIFNNPSNTVTITFNETAVRYVRLSFTANTRATGGQAAEFEVYGTAQSGGGYPDLVVTDIQWSPSNPSPGNEVTFKAVVKNQGTGTSAPGVITGVQFQINGQTVSWSDTHTTPIQPGESVTLTANWGPYNKATWTAAQGAYTVTAWVDDVDRIVESNESNNMFSKNITIGSSPTPTPTTTPPPSGQPDLIVTDIQWTPSNPSPGNEVTFKAVVKNQGTGVSAPGVVTGVQFQINGQTVSWSDTHTTPIQPGESVTLTANWGPNNKATWTAVQGTHTVTAWVDDVNRIAESNENNNMFSKSITIGSVPTPTPTTTPTQTPTPTPPPQTPPVPDGRGATMPYTRYESEDGSWGGGAILRQSLDFNVLNTASEASNQKYVALPTNGSYVEWIVKESAKGVTMRFTMPDSSDGMGLNGSLDFFVNGQKVKTIQLSSYWSWQYFNGDWPMDTPGGEPRFRFDEVHFLLNNELKSGDKVRIQKTNGDSIEYGVDFIEIEPVPAPIPKPSNAYSVTEFGATPNDSTDDLDAFVACVNAADRDGKDVYIPEGRFNLGGIWRIGASNIKIMGAGIWYTELHFTSSQPGGGGISGDDSCSGLEFCHVYMSSMLRSRYNQQAVYKAFMDTFGTNSYIHDIWEEHFECGFWIGDYDSPVVVTDGLVIANSRIRNNLADGVNFCQGTKNSTVINCSVRNNGDDGLAIWPDSTLGAPMGVNNVFQYNTIENNWRAGGIAIFGGSGHRVYHNYIKDGFRGSAIRLNTVFPGYHFENNTGIYIYDNTIVNCGTSKDDYGGERGAIDLEASTVGIKNVFFENIDIYNTQRDGVQIGYGGGFSNIVFTNILIDGTGLDAITTSRFTIPHEGKAIMVYTNNGTVVFNNLTIRNIEAQDPFLVPSGFQLIIN